MLTKIHRYVSLQRMTLSTVVIAILGVCLLDRRPVQAEDGPEVTLSRQIQPWLEVFQGKSTAPWLKGNLSLRIDGKPQEIAIDLRQYDDETFDLKLVHPEYAVEIRRRADAIAMALPKHQVVFLGKGPIDSSDHLRPKDIAKRLIGSGTMISNYLVMAQNADPTDLAAILIPAAKLQLDSPANRWKIDDDGFAEFSDDARQLKMAIDQSNLSLSLASAAMKSPEYSDWPGYTVKELDRKEIEKQLCRGVRRAFEILAPSQRLMEPNRVDRQVENGRLTWVEGQRVAILEGTPEQIGQAHGKLLQQESMRCIDSVLYAFGTAQTVATGRWFREDLEKAYVQLAPYIPERHKRETRALAQSLGLDERLVETVNVFHELFHCYGFAVFGRATKGGKLYHGRVLDYMTTIGLQDAATTFIVAPEGTISFANIGYAGFIGSVSGMNAEKISLGEMGGKGEGQWDGVPMATLMRRALEECSSLAQVRQLWESNPRTCEYYYVFADGEEQNAVGVSATPEGVEFIDPGQAHERLGEGIPDAVVLSAGSRLEELRKRVHENYGKIDAELGQLLMSRPVAMSSNLHNVLFVPEDLVFYVANASHKKPAAECNYVRIDLRDWLPKKAALAGEQSVSVGSKWLGRDTLAPSEEDSQSAKICLRDLTWANEEFEVKVEAKATDHGDLLVRFPSAVQTGNDQNDLVAMEWYQAKDASGQVMHAPAAVVVHESGSGMTVGRLIAQGLRSHGIHAFMLQLPHYGQRKSSLGKPQGDAIVAALRQGIADARRARDAVACLPPVDSKRISLQGTSLGGFVTDTKAGLDHGYHRVFILLAGGDLFNVMMQGKKDAAKMRQEVFKNGLTEEKLKELLETIEPLRLAHRIEPQKTWLFSGKFDDVVPPKNSEMLAEAANLEDSHHIRMMADHYSGVVFLPMVIQSMRDRMIEPAE